VERNGIPSPTDDRRKDGEVKDRIPEDRLRDIGLGNGTGVYDEYNEYNDSKSLPDAVEFPTAAMPAASQALIREAAESIGCPPEFVALPMLSVLGSAIGNSRVVELKRNWTEKAVIFGCVIGDPASKKTPAAKVATRPAKELQKRLKHEYREEYEDYEAAMLEHEKDKRKLRKMGESDPKPPEAPVMERTVVDDTTVEALCRVQQDSPRGVLVAKDELAGWLRGMDQYKAGGKGSDRQFWLSAWNSEPITVDRKGEPEALMVSEPFVGICGGIQPEVLEELNRGPEDGMLDRFLVAFPETVAPGWRDSEISEGAELRYSNLYQQLRIRHLQTDSHGEPLPHGLTFSDTAKAVLIDAINDHAKEMSRPGFPPGLKGVYGKLEAYFGRLCLILAMSRAVEERGPERVEASDVVAATALISYFKHMARRVYAAIKEANPLDVLAEDLTIFLQAHGGEWKGEPAALHLGVKTANKPKRANEFSKLVRAAAKRHERLEFSDDKENITRDGVRTSRRVLKLKLLETS
jgi:hypothetical protein